MVRKRDSQVKLLDHSRAKVQLLQKYLEKYLNIISNDGYTKRIQIFDLFCGEGVYENEGEGSPIVILKALKDLHFINKAKNRNIPTIDLLFNDKDHSKVEKLKSIVTEKKLHYKEFGSLHFREKEYKELVSSLISHIKSYKDEKAFIFIDPYGYKDIRASEIKQLLETKKAEVLLFLPTQFMYRFDEKGTPQSLIEILTELVNLDNWKVNSSVYGFISQFKDALSNYIGEGLFVDNFTIKKDDSTVFCLYFFSSHIRGFEKMLETKWEIDISEGKGWSYERSQNLFSTIKNNPLEEKLMTLLKSDKKIYNGDLYEYTLRMGFLPKHTNEVLSALQNDRVITVNTDNDQKVRQGAFYINYENYKSDPNRVFFKLK